MSIKIVSKGLDVSTAVRERIESRLGEIISKYPYHNNQQDNAAESYASLSKDGSGFSSLIDVHLPTGVNLQAQGRAQDAYGAVDECLTHFEKRMRRYNRRLKDHHANQKTRAYSMYVLENPVTEHEDDDQDVQSYSGKNDPIVIAETKTQIRTMSVSMASLELGISQANQIVFYNARHGKLNVVFKRTDGNIGWIDPEN